MPMQSSGVASMTLTQVDDYLKYVMIPTGSAAVVRGAPGIGKTESKLAILRWFQAQDPEFGGCCFNMANSESIDNRGLPQNSLVKSQYGMPPWMFDVPAEGLRGAYPAFCPVELRGDPSTWTPWLKEAYETGPAQIEAAMNGDRSKLVTYKRGVILLDECLQTIEESVLLTLAQLFLEHRIGEWGVPKKGWAVLGLTNRINDQAGVRELYAHVRNRVSVIDAVSDPDATDRHWDSVGMNDFFRHFARAQPGTIFLDAVPNTQEQFTTPRSWTLAHDEAMAWLTNVDNVDPKELKSHLIPHDHDMIRVMIAGRCGVATAAYFSDYLQHMNLLPSFKSILTSPATAKLPTQSAVIRTLIERCVDRVDVDTLKKVCAYVGREDMPSTMKAIFCQRLAKRMSVHALYKSNDFLNLIKLAGLGARNLLFQD